MPEPITFPLAGGIVSNFPPAVVRERGLQECVNAHHDLRYGTLGKIHGSRAVTVELPDPVDSLHFYPHFDLAGIQRRDALVAAGGSLYTVREDQTVVPRHHGMAAESLASLLYEDRIYLASEGNDPIKFDGEKVTRWGVKAPGLEEVVLEPIDNAASWTINGTNTKETDTEVEIDGASVSVSKVDTSSNTVTLTRSGLSLNLTPYSSTIRVALYIPAGLLSSLRQHLHAVEVALRDSLFGASYYRKGVGELFEGWNFLSWSGQSDEGFFGPVNRADVSAIDLSLVFSASLASGFRWDRLHTLRDDRVTVAPIGDGAVTGTVSYRVVYVTRYGQRSNAGPASASFDAGEGSKLRVSNIPISPDPQVVKRLLYRDQDGDQLFRLVGSLDDAYATTFEDDVSPAARSLEQPPLAGDPEDDNTHAPRMSHVVLYEGHAFGIDADRSFILHITPPNEIESWPITNRKVFDEGLVSIVPHARGLLFYTRNPDVTYLMTGRTLAEFRWDKWNPERAAAGRRVATTLKTLAFYWSTDGPFIDDGHDPWFVGSEILNRIRDEIDPEEIANGFLLHDRARQQVPCFMRRKDGGQSIWVYEYGKRGTGQVSTDGGVDPLDVRIGGWHELTMPDGIEARCADVIERTDGVSELWVGASDGIVYRFYSPDSAAADTGSELVPLEARIRTGRAPMIDGQRWGRPIWLVLEGNAPERTFWTCTVTVYEGATGAQRSTVTWEVPVGPGPTTYRRRIPGSRALRGAWVDVLLIHAREEQGGTIDLLQVEPLADRVRSRRVA